MADTAPSSRTSSPPTPKQNPLGARELRLALAFARYRRALRAKVARS